MNLASCETLIFTAEEKTRRKKQQGIEAIGEIRMGAGTIRIITRGSIVIDKQEFDQLKLKKDKGWFK